MAFDTELHRALSNLDGSVHTDDTALQLAAQDFGRFVSHRPLAVVRPASIEDVVATVRFAGTQGLQVAVQGAQHSTGGQSQVQDGIVIQMSALNRLSAINREAAEITVDGGAHWSNVVYNTLHYGLIPPVLTDYLSLSVGGTLSVGGFGGQSFRNGALTDNVLELTVVTGAGEVVTCSADQYRDIFTACRGGLGQFGVIVRARLKLTAATAVRQYRVLYSDLSTMLTDQQRLITADFCDTVEASVIPNDPEELRSRFGDSSRVTNLKLTNRWLYQLKWTKGISTQDEPDHSKLLPELSALDGVLKVENFSTMAFANRMETEVTIRLERGLWQLTHPFFNVFLPVPAAANIITEILESVTPADINYGQILINMVNRAKISNSAIRLPESQFIVLFSMLYNADPPISQHCTELITGFRDNYEHCRSYGGTLYPIGSVSMDLPDWQTHWGTSLSQLQEAKRHFDPNQIFTNHLF